MAKLLRISDQDFHRISKIAQDTGLPPDEIMTDLLDAHDPPLDDPLPPPPDQSREIRRLRRILNTPQYQPFLEAVKIEAAHQAARQQEYNDENKDPEDWADLLYHLQDKARRSHLSGDLQHALHHTISSAAALYHWHAAMTAEQAQPPNPHPNTTRNQ